MASLNYQGIGPRLVSQIVDGIVLIVLYFVLGAAMFGAFTFDVFGVAALSFMGVYMLLFFLYYIVLEGALGATVGNIAARIEVVREDGSPCGFGPAVVRNVLRVIDVLPFLYIIGMILISRSDKNRDLETVSRRPSSSNPHRHHKHHQSLHLHRPRRSVRTAEPNCLDRPVSVRSVEPNSREASALRTKRPAWVVGLRIG